MSCINIRCARISCALLAFTLIGISPAQRPSLRQDTDEKSSARAPSSKPGQTRSTSSASSPFAVASISARGPVDPKAVISVTFTKDVVAEEDLDTERAPRSVFNFEPSIEGTVQWDSPREAHYVPRRPLRQATEYVARINPLLKSTDNDPLQKAPEFRFSTPALTFKGASQEQFLDDRGVVLALNFSDKVKPSDLRKYLRIRAGDRDLRWKPQSEVATAKPNIITDPVTTDTLQVIIEPGLAGAGGPLGLRNRVEKKVDLNFELVPVSVTGIWKLGDPMLLLEFSSYVSTANAGKYIHIDPPVKVSYGSNGNMLFISGPFEPEKRYTIRVDKGFSSGRDKFVLNPVELVVWMPPLAPFLELPDSSGYLGTNSRMQLRVKSAMVNKLTVTARRIFDSNMVYYQNNDSVWNLERLGRKVAQQTYEIPATPNKTETSEIDLRELLGPGATGIYSLTVKGETPAKELLIKSYTGSYDYNAQSDADLERSAVINLSNLGIVAKAGEGEVVAFVAALDSAKPLAGIQVRVISEKNQLLGEATTNESGIAIVRDIPTNDTDAKPAMVMAQNADKTEISMLSLDDTLMYREEFASSGRSFLRGGYEAFLTPERGAYRPGETAHVSGFLRGRDAAVPDSAFPVKVVVERPDGKEMTPEIKTPTATGLLNFEVTIPEYAPTGLYSVDVRMPGPDETNDGGNGNDY